MSLIFFQRFCITAAAAVIDLFELLPLPLKLTYKRDGR